MCSFTCSSVLVPVLSVVPTLHLGLYWVNFCSCFPALLHFYCLCFFFFSVLLKLTFCYFSPLAWRVVFGIFFVKHKTNMIYQYTACLFSKLSFITPVPTPNTDVTLKYTSTAPQMLNQWRPWKQYFQLVLNGSSITFRLMFLIKHIPHVDHSTRCITVQSAIQLCFIICQVLEQM